MSASAPAYGHFPDRICHFHAEIFRYLVNGFFVGRSAGCGFRLTRKKPLGKAGTSGISAGTAVHTWQNTFDDFETGINIYIKYF
jgi:hypothetical protein